MTICDVCEELTMDSITICNDCKFLQDEIDLRQDIDKQDHKTGLCDMNCCYCEKEQQGE